MSEKEEKVKVVGDIDPEAAKAVWGEVKSDLAVTSFTLMDKVKAFFGL